MIGRPYSRDMRYQVYFRGLKIRAQFKAPNFYLHIIILYIIFALQLNAIILFNNT